jgi:hypothetical protein
MNNFVNSEKYKKLEEKLSEAQKINLHKLLSSNMGIIDKPSSQMKLAAPY